MKKSQDSSCFLLWNHVGTRHTGKNQPASGKDSGMSGKAGKAAGTVGEAAEGKDGNQYKQKRK